MAALVFNVERVNASTLRAQRRHDMRLGGDLSHVRSSRSPTNALLRGSGDPLADCEGVIERTGAKLRKDNTAPFTRFVFSASPDHFNDRRRFNEWVDGVQGFLSEQYGEGFAYAVLHLDEKTPHIHAVVVPVCAGKRGPVVSHRDHPATKGKDSYARLRRVAADALGLDYGEEGNKPRTLPQRLLDEARSSASQLSNQAHFAASLAFGVAADERAELERERLELERKRVALEQEREALRRDQERLRVASLKLLERSRAVAVLERIHAPPPPCNTGVPVSHPPSFAALTKQRQRER